MIILVCLKAGTPYTCLIRPDSCKYRYYTIVHTFAKQSYKYNNNNNNSLFQTFVHIHNKNIIIRNTYIQ